MTVTEKHHSKWLILYLENHGYLNNFSQKKFWMDYCESEEKVTYVGSNFYRWNHNSNEFIPERKKKNIFQIFPADLNNVMFRLESDGAYMIEYYDGIKKKLRPQFIRKISLDDLPFIEVKIFTWIRIRDLDFKKSVRACQNGKIVMFFTISINCFLAY